MIRAALLMTGKDLRLFKRDPVAMLLSILLPIVLVTVFGTIMANVGGGGGGGGGMPGVDVALLDLGQTEASRDLVEALRASASIDVEGIDDDDPRTRESLVELVRDGDVPFAILVPAGFSEGVDLELIRDPGRSLSQQLLFIGLVQALFEARGEDVIWDIQRRSMTAAGIPEEWMERVEAFTVPFRMAMVSLFEDADDAGLFEDTEDEAGDDDSGFDMADFLTDVLPVQTEDIAPEGREEQITYQVSHAVSGMTVMMLLFSLVAYARTLLEERDAGTLRRLFLAPIDPRAVLLSKLLGTFVLGLVLTGVLFVYAFFLFGLDVWTRWDSLLVISIATAACCTSFAMLVASVANTDKQADGLSTIIILVMCAVGGAWMPTVFMPDFVQTLARFTLPYWSIAAYQGTFWYGQHWTDPSILNSVGVILAIAAGMTLLASVLFKRRYLAG